MGLDMYLYRRRYVKSWDFRPEEHTEVQLKIAGKDIPLTNPAYIEEEVGYWRKANQIHGWIIRNCAQGTDDCSPVQMTRENLEDLLAVCRQVLENSEMEGGLVYSGTVYSGGVKTVEHDFGNVIVNPQIAQELLPVTPGFFFGSYGADGENPYDEYYVSDLKQTIKILESLLLEESDYRISYYYLASW